jgi:hypothetical protein
MGGGIAKEKNGYTEGLALPAQRFSAGGLGVL